MARLGTPPWHARSLVPKLFGAFVAVLALASLTTLLVETNLTRSELSAQTDQLAREQALSYQRQLSNEQVGITRSLRIFTQQVQIDASDPDRALLDTLSVARRSGPFTLAEAFDLSAGEARLDPPGRARITPPVPGSRAAEETRIREGQRRVVPLVDGTTTAGFGIVYTFSFSSLEEGTVLAVGSPLDGTFARDVRDLIGVGEVEVIVDGEVVTSTLAGPTTTPSGDLTREGVQPATDQDLLVQYLPLAVDDGWSVDTQVGLLTADPLAPLDARLGIYRAWMLLLLLVVGGVVALAFATVMTRPLVRLTRTARSIAEGDLDASFEISRHDEIGQLADALERMRRGLHSQLQVIGQQADALQSAARRIVGSRDRERQRLAQDLHDGIQQQLVVLRMQVGAARPRLRGDPTALDQVTVDLASAIDRLLDDLRATSQALYPSILHDRGLGGALHSLAARSELSIQLELTPDPLPRLDQSLEANAYFLVCEAVTNALKHAAPTTVSIVVRVDEGAVRVEVADDGRGFDPGAVGQSGLQNLRDRVNALAGSLQVVAAPGDGTRISVLLPRSPGRRTLPVLPAALEVEEHRGDAPVEVELLGQPELPEDRVGVLLDGPIGDRQVPGDGRVPPA